MDTNGKATCLSHVLALAIFLASVPVSPSEVQTAQAPAGTNSTLELVDQLKDLIQRAEKEPRANPWLIQQLRDLVRRYDWEWRVPLLYDDFRDGDYTSNPTWVVGSGEFWVTRGTGLRTIFEPSRQDRRPAERRGDNPALDILQGIFGGRKEQSAPQPVSPSEAEIYTRVRISNAFAVKLQVQLRAYPDVINRLEFGPHAGDERSSGYRLAYESSGGRSLLTLLRTAPGRSAVIEIYDRGLALEDGAPHVIEWRRGGNGEMVVLADGKEIIRTLDRGYGDSFDGFGLVNKGGDYEFREISIFGTQR